MKILKEEIACHKFDVLMAPLRQTVVDQVKKQFGTGSKAEVGRFHVTSIENPYLLEDHRALHSRDREIMNCVTFHIEQNILDILSDRAIFSNLNNLVVNKENPFLPYKERCDEILGGSWYHETLGRLKRSPAGFCEELEFLMPIILYADKTGTSANQRYPLEPFIFTLAIIRRALRNNPRSWRPLGFMPDLEAKSPKENEWVHSKNDSATPQSYHHFLEFILRSLVEVQDRGIVTWLRLRDQVKQVRIRPDESWPSSLEMENQLTC